MPEIGSRRVLAKKIPAVDLPSQASLMTLVVAGVVVATLYLAREVLIPITLAVLLSFVLAPAVARLRRLGAPKGLSVLLVVLLALGVIGLLGLVIGTQIAALAEHAPAYAATIEHKLSAVRGYVTEHVAALTRKLAQPHAQLPRGPALAPQATGGAQPVPVVVQQPDPSPFELLERVAGPLLGPLGSVGVMLVVSVFILMQSEDLRDRMIRLFGSGDLHRTTLAMDDAASRLSRYFLAQLALNAGFGVVVGLGLFLLGLPSPALFGILAGMFRFIPYIGSFAGAALPLALAAAVDPGWSLLVQVAALFLVLEPLAGQVAEPLVYGHSTGLSPVSVVISAIFWAWLWGPVGLILSMPLTLCLVVLGRHVPHLEFIDVLLGDRPALTPPESFYQRMLAGDTDEMLDQAESFLRERALSAYYEEVALPGLQMAANDRLRGVLTDEQMRNIERSIEEIVLDLADHGDRPGEAASAGGASALCIAGRGVLDKAACAMVAQLLAKRGLKVRVASPDAVSRASIEALELDEVGVICVSFIEGAGSLAPLRYLMRRLRARAPGLPIVIGLWNADGTVLQEERLRAITGADLTTASLREAVDACVAGAEPARLSLSARQPQPGSGSSS